MPKNLPIRKYKKMGQFSERLSKIGFYAILDTGYVDRDNMYNKCVQLINGGTKIIQLRAKKESDLEMAKIAAEISPLFETKNAPIFIINDNVNLAKSIPFAGLHIGQDDISPKMARDLIGFDRVLGLSTHSIEQAKEANNLEDLLDYFAVGPVYATNTKPGRQAVGLELVSEVSKMKLNLPFFAIGGVNFNTAKSVVDAGAKRLVAVSAILQMSDSAKGVEDMEKIIASSQLF